MGDNGDLVYGQKLGSRILDGEEKARSVIEK